MSGCLMPELQTAMPRYNCEILKYRVHHMNHAYLLISAPGSVSLKGDNLWCHLISIQAVLIDYFIKAILSNINNSLLV